MSKLGEWCKSHWQVFLCFILLIFIVSFVQLPIEEIMIGSLQHRIIWGLIYLILFVLAIWVASHIYFKYKTHRDKKLSKKTILFTFKMWVIAVVLEVILNYGNKLINHQAISNNQKIIISTLKSNYVVLIALGLSAVFLSPILEEFIFRGVLIDGLFSVKLFWLPIIVSGTLFSLLHSSTTIISFISYLMLGMFLAYIYKKTKSIKASILFHFFNNVIAMIMTLFYIF